MQRQPQRRPSVAAQKLRQSIRLQYSALAVAWLLVYFEARNTAWGTERFWILPKPLVAIASAACVCTFIGISVAWIIQSKMVSVDVPGNEDSARNWGNVAILVLFVLDVLGLAAFIGISRGTTAYLTLFTVLSAVTITMICPSGIVHQNGTGHCKLCRSHWPLWSWCVPVVCFALIAYLAGSLESQHIAALLGSLAAPAGKPVILTNETSAVFAVGGLAQLFMARYVREKLPDA